MSDNNNNNHNNGESSVPRFTFGSNTSTHVVDNGTGADSRPLFPSIIEYINAPLFTFPSQPPESARVTNVQARARAKAKAAATAKSSFTNPLASTMDTKMIKFNVGGHRYEVSRSLLNSYPDTMLAKSATEHWHKDPSTEIFIERDGERFRYVLDYLRDRRVSLPSNVSKTAIMTDLEYYGFECFQDQIVVSSSNFGQSALRSQDVQKEWDRDIKLKKDCTTILAAFRRNEPTTLVLSNLHREGDSFKNCNEELRKVGLCVVDETPSPQATSRMIPCFNVTLKCVD
jgi:hypothetical protein